MATAGIDGTVRLWDVEKQELIKTLRVPIGEGNEGQLYTVALSSDGKKLLCGGWTGREWTPDETLCVYFFDTASGEMLGKLPGLPNTIRKIAFSPDNSLFAVGLSGESGIAVFETESARLLLNDTKYTKTVFGLAWKDNKTLFTGSEDGIVRSYLINKTNTNNINSSKKIGEQKVNEGIKDIAISPDLSKIAVSHYGGKNVAVLSSSDLHVLYRPKTSDLINDPEKGAVANLSAVAWSSDGSTLYASGSMLQQDKGVIRAWAEGGRGVADDLQIGITGASIMAAIPDNQLVYVAYGPKWGVYNKKTDEIKEITVPRTIFTPSQVKIAGLQLSNKGAQIRYDTLLDGGDTVLFDVETRNLLAQTDKNTKIFELSDLTQPSKMEQEGFNIAAMKLIGEKSSEEQIISMITAPDKQTFFIGSTRFLYGFAKNGTRKWSINIPDSVIALAVSPDGDVLAVAYNDGTIRLYNAKTGYNLVAYFPHADKKRWLLWTRSGYYDCAPGAEEMLGWQVNGKTNQAARYYPISQFRETYYRPDVITEAIRNPTEEVAVATADEERRKKGEVVKPIVAVEKQLPPTISLLSPRNSESMSKPSLTLRYKTETPLDAPITSMRVLIDGRPLQNTKDLVRLPKGDVAEGMLTVNIPERDCQVSVIAENKNGVSSPASASLVWAGGKQPNPGTDDVLKPKLYILAVGVGSFTNPDIPPLSYAAKDAEDFAKLLQNQQGGLYKEVNIRLLTQAKATRDDIVDGLEWLERQTTQRDVAMLFLSGHGTNDNNGDYHFVPANYDPEKVKRTSVSFEDIKKTLESLAGKAIFFVDSCHAGNAVGKRTKSFQPSLTSMINDLASAENGVVVFTASTGRQVAQEDDAWQNSAFTKALLEGLSGEADIRKSGRVTVNLLDAYISDRVKEMTKGQQTPTTTKPNTIADFPLVIKR